MQSELTPVIREALRIAQKSSEQRVLFVNSELGTYPNTFAQDFLVINNAIAVVKEEKEAAKSRFDLERRQIEGQLALKLGPDWLEKLIAPIINSGSAEKVFNPYMKNQRDEEKKDLFSTLICFGWNIGDVLEVKAFSSMVGKIVEEKFGPLFATMLARMQQDNPAMRLRLAEHRKRLEPFIIKIMQAGAYAKDS